MSRRLFSHNADLQRLQTDGYFVQIVDEKFLVIRNVPYVTEQKLVVLGTLVTALELAGDVTRKPVSDHTVFFDGEPPCDARGGKMQLGSDGPRRELAPAVWARHQLSQKPEGGYADYHQKMTTYHAMLAAPANVVEPRIRPRQFSSPEDQDPDSVFEYPDTASGRYGTANLARLFEREVVALIGLGGTGAYILDKVAKTPVREIRLFDADEFLNHNAYRAPGAASLEELREAPRKVDYFSKIYSRMHRRIIPHATNLGPPATLSLLEGVTSAFIAIDDGPHKLAIAEKLESIEASFIDVGMGLHLEEGDSLGGILRATVSVPGRREVLRRRVSFAQKDELAVYSTNIQVADLNSLNADLAVIKWKKLLSYYRDLENELHTTYTTDGNVLINTDRR